MNASETRLSWTCAECSVTSRRPEVGAVPMPTGWTVADDRLLCLSCARRETGTVDAKRAERQRRSAAALRDAREDREADVRAGLAARAPAQGGGPVAEVAEETGFGESLVRDVRKKMRDAGELPPAGRGRPGGADAAHRELQRSAAASALRADPDMSDAEIAAEIGAPPKVVARARKKLGLPSAAEAKAKRTRAAVAAALADRPTGATAQEIADAVDRSFPTAKRVLDDLASKGWATVLRRGRGPGALYTPTGD